MGLWALESFEGLVRRLVDSFNAFGLEDMFTGALAVSYYGGALVLWNWYEV